MSEDQGFRPVIGRHEAVALAGENMLHQLEQLRAVSPSLSRSLLDDGFGNVLANAVTGYREWNLQVLAVLTVLGDAGDQTEVYLKAALAHGATDDEVNDVISLSGFYAGAPRAVNGARRVASYLAQRRQVGGAGATERLVSLGDHTTLVLDSGGTGLAGEGVPIFLIHALDMDHRFWREIFSVLAAENRVIAYDIRGHGHARGAPLTTSLNQLSDDVGRLLDQLGIDKVDIYGASYGGAIAQIVALNLTERVRSMALLATGAKVPRDELRARANDAEQHGMAAQVGRSLTRWFLPETIAQDLWMVRYARARVLRARPQEWAAAWRAMAELDVVDRVKALDMPVLVLSGTKDLSSKPDMMRATADIYQHAEFQSIDGGTHMMPMEQPKPVAAALAAFRSRTDEAFRLPKAI